MQDRTNNRRKQKTHRKRIRLRYRTRRNQTIQKKKMRHKRLNPTFFLQKSFTNTQTTRDSVPPSQVNPPIRSRRFPRNPATHQNSDSSKVTPTTSGPQAQPNQPSQPPPHNKQKQEQDNTEILSYLTALHSYSTNSKPQQSTKHKQFTN
jgi:hypothetical protein